MFCCVRKSHCLIFTNTMNVTPLYVSEWVMHAGVKVRVYCPLGQANKGKYALSIAVKALDLFAE